MKSVRIVGSAIFAGVSVQSGSVAANRDAVRKSVPGGIATVRSSRRIGLDVLLARLGRFSMRGEIYGEEGKRGVI